VAINIARVYDAKGSGPGGNFLIDRLWPRGLAKADAPFEDWLKELAPSPELRKWYSHEVEKFDEFARRYREELADPSEAEQLDRLRERARRGRVVLLTATRDLEHSSAAVLRDVLMAQPPSLAGTERPARAAAERSRPAI
jgi:uncharacterized protein YeaO (DUF488 family)